MRLRAPEIALPIDARAIEALLLAAFEDYAKRLGRDAPGPFDWVAPAIGNRQIHVWREDGVIVAMVKLSDDPAEAILTLDMFAVAPQRARCGRGTQILAWVEQEARARGRAAIRLHTAQMMDHLVAFYRRNGFVIRHVGPHPTARDPHLRVFMEKRLEDAGEAAAG